MLLLLFKPERRWKYRIRLPVYITYSHEKNRRLPFLRNPAVSFLLNHMILSQKLNNISPFQLFEYFLKR